MNNYKIIYLFTPGPIGGAEKVLIAGLRALCRDHESVELWLIKETRVPHVMENFLDLIRNIGIPYRIFESRGVIDSSLVRNLRKSFNRSGTSIIHSHGFKATFYAYLTKPEDAKLVVTHHGRTSHTLKVRIYEKIESFIMKRAHGVIAVSGKMKTELVEEGIHNKKIFLVENILSLNHNVQKLKNGGQINLLFSGRLSPEKGCAFLLDAIKLLPSGDRPLVTIIGDGPERSALENQAKELDISDSVRFLGFQKDVHSYLENCDALIMPSLREGQPLSLIEACCSGLSVLASDVGGIPELVEHQVNGLLFVPGDSRDIADKIGQFKILKADIQRNAELRRKAFNLRFSDTTWVQNTNRVYETVVSHL